MAELPAELFEKIVDFEGLSALDGKVRKWGVDSLEFGKLVGKVADVKRRRWRSGGGGDTDLNGGR